MSLQAGGFYLSFVVTASAALVLFIALLKIADVDCKRDEAGGNLMG